MTSESAALAQTVFHSMHVDAGARMVPFAGYEMPVQYPQGVMQEHLHTREQAGLFDVSHMGQVVIRGEGVEAGLESLIPTDLGKLEVYQQVYGVLTAEDGGILDDLIITRWEDGAFFLVVNAACKEADIAHLRKHLPNADIEVMDDRALLALQGPAARSVMSELAPEAAELTFMHGRRVQLADADCFVTCSGYTGEDGFEISVANSDAEALAALLLEQESVKWIGLGARDSLRLEAGLCLYGHDMDSSVSPIEASLIWSISKTRRDGGEKAGGFLGADRIFAQIANGVSRKRVGLKVEGKAPVREGAEIINSDGEVVGKVTSGGFGPSYGAPVAMGLVDIASAAVDTPLQALVRGKPRDVVVAKTPFVPQRYHRG